MNNLDIIDHLLTTTRTVRKRLDLERSVEPAVIRQCLSIALQAPTGSNQQGWRFLVVTDPVRRRGLADLYRRAWVQYSKSAASRAEALEPDDPRTECLGRVISSASYLAENFHRVPVHIVCCIEGRVEDQGVTAQASLYGSILPAAWSLMLALRSRGLGAAWTTLHLMFEQEAARLLGIPPEVTQAALLPVAYFTGEDFKPARRIPASEVTYWDNWGALRP